MCENSLLSTCSELTKAEKEQELAKSMEGLSQALSRGEGSRWFRSFLNYIPLSEDVLKTISEWFSKRLSIE
jgi:hypothetical protein